MATRATAIWWAAMTAGAGYYLADALVAPGVALTMWKGSGVGLLALWAAVNARSIDGGMLAGVLALGALGDVLLEASGLTVGAVAFLAGHLLAIVLYRRQARIDPPASQRLAGLALAVGTPLVSWVLTADPGVTIYAAGLGGMAAAAWLSRFPRYRLGIGAVLFVASDLLIFARMGPLMGSAVPGLLIWPLYFAGQALIATAGVRVLSAAPRS